MKRNIIQFNISKGEKYFVAAGVDFPVITQAKTLDALYKNIKEAVILHLSDHGTVSDLGLSNKPSVITNMEIPLYA